MPGQYCKLFYHLVWATRMREPMIDNELKEPLHGYLKYKIRQLDGIPYAIGGISEHVHCLVFIPPQLAIATFIGNLKGASSHWVNHEAKPGGEFAWRNGYSVFTVSSFKPGLRRPTQRALMTS